MVNIRTGMTTDIPNLLQLNKLWNKENLTDTNNGFLSVLYSFQDFEAIINNEDLLVFETENTLIGYALCNNIIETERVIQTKEIYFELFPQNKSKKNGFGYQILIDKNFQGTGLFTFLQEPIKAHFEKKYDILVSTLNKNNTRSFKAHSNTEYKLTSTINDFYIFEWELQK